VTLTGKVPEGDQIEKAGTVAQGVAGVTSVTNKLTLKEQ
jgi:hyperosmotically inducible protein